MGDEVLRLYDAAMQLPDSDRAELAELLRASLGEHATQATIDASWIAEAKWRLTEVRAGRMETVPYEEVIRKARAAIEQAERERAG